MGIPTAEEQEHGPDVSIHGCEAGALLKQAAEWGDPCTGGDEDEGCGGVAGELEGGFANVGVDFCASFEEGVCWDGVVVGCSGKGGEVARC